MSERRFTEEESAEILKRAVELQDAGTSVTAPRSGLTLAELQDIGREVGVAPESIARAARNVGTAAKATRKWLGLPLGVARTVELNRTLTDDEWDRLAAHLRETFDAHGVVRKEGAFRSWSNGNLQVMLEPTTNGQRLRLRTVNGSARSSMIMAAGLVGVAALTAMAGAIKGTIGNTEFLSVMTIVLGTGTALLGFAALRLPGWARTRRQQMDEIADRISSSETP